MQKLEAECLELKRQILQLEFQHKKDRAEFERRSKIWAQKSEQRKKDVDKNFRHLSAHAAHLSKLTGITFEELDAIDERLDSASNSLKSKKKS